MNDSQSNDNLVVVEQCASPFAANALVALLSDYDIKAYGPEMAMKVMMSGSGLLQNDKKRFPVFVLESQLELASRTIREVRAEAAELDWEQVDVGTRTDSLPLKHVSAETPGWFRAVAVAGLVLLGLTVAGGIVYLLV